VLALTITAHDADRLALSIDDDYRVHAIRLARPAEVLEGFTGAILACHRGMVANWRSNRSYERNGRFFVFSVSKRQTRFLHLTIRRKLEGHLGLESILPFLSFLLFER
jgi:hypothetical protein